MEFVARARFFALALALASAVWPFDGKAQDQSRQIDPLRQIEQVAVRAEIVDGTGRLVLDWPRPVVFSAEIREGMLVLRFARPFAATFGPAVKTLGEFVAAGGLYSDRRSAVFALRRELAVASFAEGGRVVVELSDPGPRRPRPAAGPAAPPVAPLAAAPPEPPAEPPASKPVAEPPLERPVQPPGKLERARAFQREGNPDRALAAIRDETGEGAELIREEIFWRRGDWQRAAAAALALAERLPEAGELSKAARRQVLDAAVAATLAGDRAALQRLAHRFGADMERSDYRHPFRLLTEEKTSGNAKTRAARAVETAEGVQRFLAGGRPVATKARTD